MTYKEALQEINKIINNPLDIYDDIEMIKNIINKSLFKM
jgi:hypothetical protein